MTHLQAIIEVYKSILDDLLLENSDQEILQNIRDNKMKGYEVKEDKIMAQYQQETGSKKYTEQLKKIRILSVEEAMKRNQIAMESDFAKVCSNFKRFFYTKYNENMNIKDELDLKNNK